MSTIKTWQEREQLDIEPIRLPEECYMQDEIDELREALKAAQAQIDSFCMDYRIKCDAETKALQAKLSAIEAQEPVAWVYEDELPSGYPYDLMFPFSKVDGVRLFPIFAPVAPAHPVNELVEALECLIATHWPLEEATTSDGCYTDDPNEIKARKALANAKEQVEKVIGALENSVDSVEHEYKQAVELYGGIPRRAAKIDGLLLLWRNHTEAIEIMKGMRT